MRLVQCGRMVRFVPWAPAEPLQCGKTRDRRNAMADYQEFLDGIDRKAYHEGEWQ